MVILSIPAKSLRQRNLPPRLTGASNLQQAQAGPNPTSYSRKRSLISQAQTPILA